MNKDSFSHKLEQWLNGNSSKTLASLVGVFEEKSFAVAFVVLLFIPALPLPTGGATHIFELAAMLLALEIIWGRQNIWLPKSWLNKSVSFMARYMARIVGLVSWVERHSQPRFRRLMQTNLFLRVTGLIIFIFCLTAFLAPPFSGLDTLPSLAVVLLGLSLILDDILIYFLAIIIGAIGISLILILGAALISSFHWF